MPVSSGSHWLLSERMEEADDVRSSSDKRDDISESPAVLAGLIEGQIIPRLLCVHRRDARRSADGYRERISPLQAEGFAPMVLRLEAHALMEQVEGFLARGASVESILVDLLAPAARQLGLWWEEDACDFVDVTMGLWRLQQVVYELSARLPGKAPATDRSRKGLFTVFPGSQHSFGTVVIEECFRREGWLTTCLTGTTEPQLLKMVSDHNFDLVGMTISHDHEAERAADLIGKLRSSSRNPMLGVMVGGRVLVETPELALQMGADATAYDAESAVARAEFMLHALDEQAVNRC
jgi:MerR family transcriptional regulator, light-induced transcriptional regulator